MRVHLLTCVAPLMPLWDSWQMVSGTFWNSCLLALPCSGLLETELPTCFSLTCGSGSSLPNSGRISGWVTLQHHRQALQLEHSLLGGGSGLYSQHSCLLLASKYPHQDGPSTQEGRVKRVLTMEHPQPQPPRQGIEREKLLWLA